MLSYKGIRINEVLCCSQIFLRYTTVSIPPAIEINEHILSVYACV